MILPTPRSTLFPYTTLFRSGLFVDWQTTRDLAAMTGQKKSYGCNHSDSWRSEEHTSELQSQSKLVCRLLLEKKKMRAALAIRTSTMPGSVPMLLISAAAAIR